MQTIDFTVPIEQTTIVDPLDSEYDDIPIKPTTRSIETQTDSYESDYNCGSNCKCGVNCKCTSESNCNTNVPVVPIPPVPVVPIPPVPVVPIPPVPVVPIPYNTVDNHDSNDNSNLPIVKNNRTKNRKRITVNG